MAVNKQIRETGKTLLQLSMKGDEVSSERVNAVLQALKNRPPRNYRQVLREYLRLVRKQIERNQAIVEYAGALPSDLVNSIEANLSAQYGRPITAVLKENKSLIAGWKIRVGSDLYDSSVSTRLRQLNKTTVR